ncbi:MAG: acyltransferase [Deltaproteobacteria bacterium]|nr:acyltransferase [Deltaproteobacteria bacterium]
MSSSRIEQLDGLRALAFLAVFFFHAIHMPLGFLGVDLFFALSGYLITRNLLELRAQTTSRAMAVFYYRRLLRIIPPYFLALAVMILLGDLPLATSGWYFAFCSNIHDSFFERVNGAPLTLWSIAVEEQFYLVWPLLVLLVPRRRLVAVLVAAVVVSALSRWWWAGNHDAVYRLMPCRMDTLALGAILAAIDLDEVRRRSTTWIAIAVGAGAISLGYRFAIGRALHRPQDLTVAYEVVGYGITAIAFAAVLAFVRAHDHGRVHAVLSQPLLRYIGKISYMAYLIHVVAIELVQRHVHSTALIAPLALALTVGWASLTWYLVEQPLSTLRRWVTPRPVRS